MKLIGAPTRSSVFWAMVPLSSGGAPSSGALECRECRAARFKLLLPAGVSKVPYQMAHQCLRHGGIDAVHGHMIPVVGGPAQRQLRHVSCASDHSSGLVCNIHEEPASTLSGWEFSWGHRGRKDRGDIRKWVLTASRMSHLHQRRPQLSRQKAGIIVGAVCGAEAGHGHRVNLAPGVLPCPKAFTVTNRARVESSLLIFPPRHFGSGCEPSAFSGPWPESSGGLLASSCPVSVVPGTRGWIDKALQAVMAGFSLPAHFPPPCFSSSRSSSNSTKKIILPALCLVGRHPPALAFQPLRSMSARRWSRSQTAWTPAGYFHFHQ